MGKWVKKTLKDASVYIIDGDRGDNYPKKEEFTDSGFCLFLNTGNVTKTGFNFDNKLFITKEKDKLLRKGKLKRKDLVLTTRGTVGNVAFFDKKISYENIRINSGMVILRVDEKKICPYYLYIILRSEFFKIQVLKLGSGSAQPQLPIKSLNYISFPWYKIETQKKIAKVLSDLDAKIELNNRINAELEGMAKLLYDYWFVQFDFPDANGKPYKSSGGKMVYNNELKREIPEGWGSGTINDIAEIIRGVSYNKHNVKSSNDENVTPILRATNIIGNAINLDNMVYVPNEFVSDNQILNKFDILITMSSGSITHIGKNGMFYFDERAAFGAFCAKLISNEKFRFYLFFYTQSEFMSTTIKNECLGTNINNLNGSMIKSFKLVLPNIDCLKSFNQKVLHIFNKIANNQKQNQQLISLRDWLLPMLMNGQVRVGEISRK